MLSKELSKELNTDLSTLLIKLLQISPKTTLACMQSQKACFGVSRKVGPYHSCCMLLFAIAFGTASYGIASWLGPILSYSMA